MGADRVLVVAWVTLWAIRSGSPRMVSARLARYLLGVNYYREKWTLK